MPATDPTSYSMITYLWVSGLAAWGGVVNYIRKVKDGHSKRFSITELVGEIVTSSFAGVITFWLCEMSQIDSLFSAVLIAISGHMGARAIYLIEAILEKRYKG
ncbi:MAG: phage holin family protein [Candidatus Sedimenticola sp. (ex Thyasira tokunagai)]